MPTILVTGATGQQGSSVIRALQSTQASNPDIHIIALTRNPSSPSAAALKSQGIEVRKGDLQNRSSLVTALNGCDAAYLVTDFRGPGDIEGEVEQGKNFIDACVEVGIKHITFSSVSGSPDPAVSHFHSKFHIESHLTSSTSYTHTILRPTGFLDLIPPPSLFRSIFLSTMYAVFRSVPQKWIACEDIGKAAATSLLNPEKYHGKVIELVGYVGSVEDVARELGEGDGGRGFWVWFPRWMVVWGAGRHYGEMFEWLAKGVQPGSVEETRKVVPDVMDVRTWAARRAKRE